MKKKYLQCFIFFMFISMSLMPTNISAHEEFDPPVLDGPIIEGAQEVSGSYSLERDPVSAAILVYVNNRESGSVNVRRGDGDFTVRLEAPLVKHIGRQKTQLQVRAVGR